MSIFDSHKNKDDYSDSTDSQITDDRIHCRQDQGDNGSDEHISMLDTEKENDSNFVDTIIMTITNKMNYTRRWC
ncbi:MAG TPA: hypothetical protein VHT34_11165 [Clostridia bacterium]|nr:hypothetical protein [Clostridia bacterium]